MRENDIPNQCPKCGMSARLRDPLEPSLTHGKEWRCARECVAYDVR